MQTWVPLIVACLALSGVIGSAILQHLGVRRSTSGNVQFTDAQTLFRAGETIRLEQRDRIEKQDERIEKQGERIAVLENDIVGFALCRERLAILEADVKRLGNG